MNRPESESQTHSPSRGGVFSGAADPRVNAFTESISLDRRLYAEDIEGSIAHANMLSEVGLISSDERSRIVSSLEQIRQEIEAGAFAFRNELEDIHMHVEQALIDRLGDLGRKLHTARSRNDQVSTDMRLWTRRSIDNLVGLLAGLQSAFVGRCDQDADVVLPAYTHLQRAMPVVAPHYWLAYCEKLQRDKLRLIDCRRRADVCPLGTAAVAGTTLPIDRDSVARKLGFGELSTNSLDASSDRDFLIEFTFCLALIADHLSGWAEEWILWSTTEFGFLRLPQAFCTGSSIMPQKINPDVLELMRGKTASVLGNLQALLILIKGLPLAYNRDLQEDKEAVFRSYDTVRSSLQLAIPVVAGAELQRDAIRQHLATGFLDATALMEYFITRGVPQRSAHQAVGLMVRQATEQKRTLQDLSIDDFRAACPRTDQDVYDVLGVENALHALRGTGSSAPDEVIRQVARWREILADCG